MTLAGLCWTAARETAMHRAIAALAAALTCAACTDAYDPTVGRQPPPDTTSDTTSDTTALVAPAHLLVDRGDGLKCTQAGDALSSGALFQVCLRPANWGGDLIVFIPGYHDPNTPPALPDDLGGADAVKTVTDLGYAIATTSFRGAGLMDPSTWIDGDLVEL